MPQTEMANYGKLGPSGALLQQKMSSVDEDFRDLERSEQHLLKQQGFYGDRSDLKRESDLEFHRIVGAQQASQHPRAKTEMSRESFVMAARQIWGLDAPGASAVFKAADLRGLDCLNRREYLILREAFHHKDARPNPALTKIRCAALFHKYDRRGERGSLTPLDYRDFIADLCAGDTHVTHVLRSVRHAKQALGKACDEAGAISLADFSEDLMDADVAAIFQKRGLSGGDLLGAFKGGESQRHKSRYSHAGARDESGDAGQASRPGLKVALEHDEMIAKTAATAAPLRRTMSAWGAETAVTQPVGREAINESLALDADLECEFEWRGPGAAERGSKLWDVASLVVDNAHRLARECCDAVDDCLDSEWLLGDAGLKAVLGPGDEHDWASKVVKLAHAAKKIAAAQPPLVRARLPSKIFGDLHGQLRDALVLFGSFGFPTHKGGDVELCSYVFNGDYIDRGTHQCELVCLLLALKVLYPTRVYLLRGNHEFRTTSENMKQDSFLVACQTTFPKHWEAVYEACFDVFAWLPLAGLVGDRILVVHGGVGDGTWSLGDLQTVQRPLTHLGGGNAASWVLQALWSDPSDSDADMKRGVHNSPRGGKILTFGPDVTDAFCEDNAIDVVVRSHQYVRRGYKYMHGGRLVTLFSARNYFGKEKNDSAILLVARDGYGQIRIRPKRLPAFDTETGVYPSLEA